LRADATVCLNHIRLRIEQKLAEKKIISFPLGLCGVTGAGAHKACRARVRSTLKLSKKAMGVYYGMARKNRPHNYLRLRPYYTNYPDHKKSSRTKSGLEPCDPAVDRTNSRITE